MPVNPESPHYSSHDAVHHETHREKAEREAVSKAFSDYAQSPAAGEITKLFAEVQLLKDKWSRMQGRGGFVFTDGIIELIENASEAGSSSGTEPPVLNTYVLRVAIGGVAEDINVYTPDTP